MLCVDDVIALIKQEASRLPPDDDSVASMRHWALLNALAVLGETGFPTDRELQLDTSLVPFIFQEANYDDIDWTSRLAPLHHLSEMFLIDIAVQTGGRERHELDDKEYKDYVSKSNAAIRFRMK